MKEKMSRCEKCFLIFERKYIFINKDGYGFYYCRNCGDCGKLSELEMRIVGKLGGTKKCPLMN